MTLLITVLYITTDRLSCINIRVIIIIIIIIVLPKGTRTIELPMDSDLFNRK